MASDDKIVTDPQTFKRVSRQLRKLSFSNPGPQMKTPSAAWNRHRRVKSQPLTSQPTNCCSQPCEVEKQEKEHEYKRACQVATEEKEETETQSACDCLHPDCPGCFFPCTECGSQRCGVVCQQGRGWKYSQEERVEASTCQ